MKRLLVVETREAMGGAMRAMRFLRKRERKFFYSSG